MKPLKSLINKTTISKFASGYEVIPIDIDIDRMYEFGNIIQLFNETHYITLGNNEPKYVKDYKKSGVRSVPVAEYIAICFDGNDSFDFVEIDDYIDQFPNDWQDFNYDIIKMYKTNLSPKDIDTTKKLKDIFKLLKLNVPKYN